MQDLKNHLQNHISFEENYPSKSYEWHCYPCNLRPTCKGIQECPSLVLGKQRSMIWLQRWFLKFSQFFNQLQWPFLGVKNHLECKSEKNILQNIMMMKNLLKQLCWLLHTIKDILALTLKSTLTPWWFQQNLDVAHLQFSTWSTRNWYISSESAKVAFANDSPNFAY